MGLNIIKTASEYGFDNPGGAYTQIITQRLLKHKINGLMKGLLIPDDLIAELERYAERNKLSKIVDECYETDLTECCPRCLKAHMLKTANKLELSKDIIKFLGLFMPGEAGHHGYYTDNEMLIKI